MEDAPLIAILAGYVFCSAAILQTGRAALRITGSWAEQMYRPERLALQWVLGSAVISSLVLLLAACQMLAWWPLVLLGAAGIAAGFAARKARSHPLSLTRFEKVALAAGLLFLTVYFIAALAPSDDADGYRYHLGFPKLYRAAGGLIPIRLEFYSAFPQATEMLFLFGLEFGGFSVANLLHWNFLVALAAGMWGTGLRYNVRSAGAAAALAVTASSVTGTTVPSASVELALAAAAWMSAHCWLRWFDSGTRAWLIGASVAAGFACGVKYTGITTILVSAVFLIVGWRGLAPIALASGVASLWIAPWLLRNWLYFDNPVYPFLNAWFPNPYMLPYAEAEWVENLRHYNGAKVDASFPWETTIVGKTTMGFIGPYFLAAPLALLAVRSVLGRWMVVCAVITAAPWLLGNPTARFGIPTLPFLALAIALGCATLPGRAGSVVLGALVAVHAVMDFPLFIERWNKQPIVALKEIPWRRAIRIEKPLDYWVATLDGYRLLKELESESPRSARVLVFDDQYQFFTTRLLASFYGSEPASTASWLLEWASDPNTWPVRKCVAEFAAVSSGRLRLSQSSEDKYAWWTLFEVNARPRIDHWAASENPWGSRLAGDGDLVTAWTTKRSRLKGMWFELQWDRPEPISKLHYVTSPNHEGELRVLQPAGDGQWAEVQGLAIECRTVDVPDFPKRAMRLLKAQGWTHILARRGPVWMEQAIAQPNDWGIRVAGVNGSLHLLEIK